MADTFLDMAADCPVSVLSGTHSMELDTGTISYVVLVQYAFYRI